MKGKGKTKQELEAAREIAFMLYMSSVTSKEIADRVGVSEQSVSKWVNDGLWKEKRAAKTITRQELINKTLNQINDLLSDKDAMTQDSGVADKLSKLVAIIEKLDKKNSPVQVMDVFIDFVQWLQKQSITDKLVTVDLIKQINRYQDSYITTLMSGK
ncbi:MAG TPA: hypothetical protein VK179_09925 [Bacteroidales bacterium]|nr:hypothetical protein [Bacteroidales bacterium]